MRVRAAASTDVGRIRANNEDSYVVSLPLVAVADGMGGENAGEVASAIVVDVLATWRDTPDAAADGLADAVLRAHREILVRARSTAGLEGMGTTVTAAWVDDSSATVAHVGDSRAYLMRAGGLQQLTEDHSWVQQLVRQGQLTAEEAAKHPQRSQLTQALGAQDDVQVETVSLDLHAGDRLLIASDGLHGQAGMSERRIREVLASNEDPKDACRALVEEANAAGGHDNVTVVLVDVAGAADADQDEPAAEPVIVERPTTGTHRTPVSRRRTLRRAAVAATVAVVAVAVAAVMVTRAGAQRIIVTERDGRVAILDGRPEDPSAARVVELTDRQVQDLPPSFRRRVESGIVVGSVDEARRTIATLPRMLEADETPAPTPPPPEPSPTP